MSAPLPKGSISRASTNSERSSPAPPPYQDRDEAEELAKSKKSEEAKSVNRMLRPTIRNMSEFTTALEELLDLYSPTGRCATLKALNDALSDSSSKYHWTVAVEICTVSNSMGRVIPVLSMLGAGLGKVSHRVKRGDLLEGVIEVIETLCNILDDVNLLVKRLREQLRLTNRAWSKNSTVWEILGLQKDIETKCNSVIGQMHAFRLDFDPSLA
jgi:hypothetical protein